MLNNAEVPAQISVVPHLWSPGKEHDRLSLTTQQLLYSSSCVPIQFITSELGQRDSIGSLTERHPLLFPHLQTWSFYPGGQTVCQAELPLINPW